MSSRRPSPTSHARPAAGFSFTEMLVVLLVSGLLLTAAAGFFNTSTALVRRHELRLEVQQALGGTFAVLARDIRLAGSCLPFNGDFLGLEGTDNGLQDSITIRSGLLLDDLGCLVTALKQPAAIGDTQLFVDSAAGFEPEMLLYLRHPNGTGDFMTTTAVDPNLGILEHGDSLSQGYPVGSGVYALTERAYGIDASDPAMPVLTLAVDGQPAQPFARGIQTLDLRYELDRNCPPCDLVDLPADNAEWWLVGRLQVTVTATTPNPVQPQDAIERTITRMVKPRNLLP